MPVAKRKMALLDGLDQYSAYYSVICVFGSVVGCVVVPLITQSIEGIILSAIVISLTAKTIHSRSFSLREDTQDDRKRGGRDHNFHEKRTKKKKMTTSTSSRTIDTEVVRRQRQEELLRLQEQKTVEKQQKLEEKRLKKARKREEKQRLKEEEEREKTREALQKKERDEKRVQLKQKRSVIGLGGVASLDTIDSLTREPLVTRERKNSSSSSGSNRSTRSLPRPRPPRMAPPTIFTRASSDSYLPSTPSLPPSPPLSVPLPDGPPPSPPMSVPLPDRPPPIFNLPSPSKSTSEQTVTNGNHKPMTSEKNTVTLLPMSPPHQNHSSNNNHQPPHYHTTHHHNGHYYAVNPLAPSSSVTMATSLIPGTATMATVAKAWNEQMYYWTVDRAGLTQPLQYGWDPVALPSSHPHTCPYVPLTVQPPPLMNSPPALWGSTATTGGPFLPPTTTNINQPHVPPNSCPTPTSFGAIGNAPPTSVAMTTDKQTSNSHETRANSGSYSLFSGAQQTLFAKSLLPNGQENSTVAMDTPTCGANNVIDDDNEEITSLQQDVYGFDKWPAI